MKTRITLIILLVISLVFGVFFSFPFLETITNTNPNLATFITHHPIVILLFIIGFALQLLGHVIRAVKHRVLLQEIRPIRLREVFKGQMIGFLFNVLLPFRLGEIIRAHYIGRGVWISRSAVFATIVFERFIDLLVVGFLGILVVVLLSLSTVVLVTYTLVTLGAAVVLAIALLIIYRQPQWILFAVYHLTRIFNDRLKNRSRQLVWSFSYALRHTINRRTVKPYLLYTGLMWVCYLLSIVVVSLPFIPAFQSGSSLLLSAISPYFGISSVSGPAYANAFNSIFTRIMAPSFGTQNLLYLSVTLWLLLVIPSLLFGIIFIYRKQVIAVADHNRLADVMKNKLYRDTDISEEFGNFLDSYFKGAALDRIINREETSGKFRVIKHFKGGSNAVTLLAWQDSRMTVKKITLPEYKTKLSSQYEWLAKYSRFDRITKVVGEHDSADFYAIDIDFKEEFVPFFEFIHASEPASSWRILKSVYGFMNRSIYKTVPVSDKSEKLQRYIDDKIVNKVIDTANTTTHISQLMAYDSIEVNGRMMSNFKTVIEKIRNNKSAMRDLLEFEESDIHGDLTIDNVIVEPVTQEYLLLDPNNENAISDPIVDYGKLLQSLHSGYEFLVMMGDAHIKGNVVNFEEKKSMQYEYLYKKFDSLLKRDLTPARYKSLLFHEAVHYCRMLTYRASINQENVAAFYAIAIRLFNDYIEQYEKKR